MMKRNVAGLLFIAGMSCSSLRAEFADVEVVQEAPSVAEVVPVVGQHVRDLCEECVMLFANTLRNCIEKSSLADGSFNYTDYVAVQANLIPIMAQEIQNILSRAAASGVFTEIDQKLFMNFLNFVMQEFVDFSKNEADLMLRLMNAKTKDEAAAISNLLEKFIVAVPAQFFAKLSAGAETVRESVQQLEKIQLLPEPEEGRSIEEVRNQVSYLLSELIEIQVALAKEVLSACVNEEGVFDGKLFFAQQGSLMQKSMAATDARLIELARQGITEKEAMYITQFFSFLSQEMAKFQGRHQDFIMKFVEAKTQQEALALLNLSLDVIVNAKALFLEQNFPATAQA